MLMASTLRPPMDCTPMMVCTHSYRMAFPAFRAPSVFVATCAKMSLMASLAAASPAPRIRSSLSTCRGKCGVRTCFCTDRAGDWYLQILSCTAGMSKCVLLRRQRVLPQMPLIRHGGGGVVLQVHRRYWICSQIEALAVRQCFIRSIMAGHLHDWQIPVREQQIVL